MTDTKAVVCCSACELRQYQRESCRRCGRKLPQFTDAIFGSTAPVVPLSELERRAIIHALRKSPNATEAAKRLGIGRTTLYCKAQELAIPLKRRRSANTTDATI